MPPHPTHTPSELDMERKEELIMEKKLRACRVNIIPRTGGYFRETSLPPPVSKRPAPPPVSPEAVIKASNPIALRYWNQCTSETKSTSRDEQNTINSEVFETPPWVSESSLLSPTAEAIPKLPPKTLKVPDITHKMGHSSLPDITQGAGQTPHDDPSPMTERKNPTDNKTEIVKVLSTAGTGIKRNNEVMEALGNINRFITVDKVKKSDDERVKQNADRMLREGPKENENGHGYKDSYQEIKQEEIKRSQQRANFMNTSEKIRIPKSPRPFRDQSQSREVQKCNETCGNSTNESNKPDKATDIQHLQREVIPNLNQAQKTQLGMVLFSQMPTDTVMDIVAQQLSVMSGPQMASTLGCLENQAINTAIPLLFAKTKSEVRRELIGETLPSLDRREIIDILTESEEEIPELIEGLIERVGYSSRQRILKYLLEKEDIFPKVNQVPEIRIENTTDIDHEVTNPEELNWGWEQGEDLEYEFYECDGGRDPMGL